jgi:CRISPR-associated endonuclease/helicase Cas3
MGLHDYFEAIREDDGRRVLGIAGIIGHPRKYCGVGDLLERGKKPRSLQTIVDGLPLEPGLTIIEAPTGSGKTEAALAYAWRIIDAGLADSIVFALPTQATANAMLGRLKLIAPHVFGEQPNLLLAHGSARFNKEFVKIKHAALKGYEKEDGWVQCSEWLAESRKRVFLGQIGVCTVDQVLISVLPVKHRFVRGFGIGRSVLIVDEVHAYDAYMYGLLEEVLKQQYEAGGSAMLLSATLPERQRQQLCNAWGMKLEKQGGEALYPLATWTCGRTILPFVLDPSERPQNNSVFVEPIRVSQMVPDEILLRRIVAAAEQGAQVAIVCNLVDIAQGLARILRTMTTLPVDLFHARYCFIHRREKELDAIDRFGPKGDRAMGRILVATQVIEQSLDLDFDWLITQLCPVDLLFQRMGRLHRHSRPVRSKGFEKPRCTVLLPDNDSYGLHALIYANKRALWRTGLKLLSATGGEIVFPDAYRIWIESVYQEGPWVNEPDDITASYEKFRDEVEDVKGYLAKQMIERARGMNPFADTDEVITAVTRDGEMNRTIIPYCRTTQGTLLMDGTVLESLDEHQRREALSLNSVGVPHSWHYFEGVETDEERRYRLEMEKDGESYTTKINGVTFSYHKDIGLEKKK